MPKLNNADLKKCLTINRELNKRYAHNAKVKENKSLPKTIVQMPKAAPIADTFLTAYIKSL
jgi:hypothetical protein